jgi:hypothetical protein
VVRDTVMMIHLPFISVLWFQGSFPGPSDLVTSYIVPIAGFCIVVFCFVASARLASPLKFDGFGIHLEITILSLLVLLGVAMMLAGYIVHILDLSTKERTAEEKAQHEEARADAAEHFTLRLALAYPKEDVVGELEPHAKTPGEQAKNLTCRYKLASSKNPEDTQVMLGQQGTVEVVIDDFSRNDVIQDLTIAPADPSKVSGRVLAVHNVYPFQPKYLLSGEKVTLGVH